MGVMCPLRIASSASSSSSVDGAWLEMVLSATHVISPAPPGRGIGEIIREAVPRNVSVCASAVASTISAMWYVLESLETTRASRPIASSSRPP
jgi:hypothetical protein